MPKQCAIEYATSPIPRNFWEEMRKNMAPPASPKMKNPVGTPRKGTPPKGTTPKKSQSRIQQATARSSPVPTRHGSSPVSVGPQPILHHSQQKYVPIPDNAQYLPVRRPIMSTSTTALNSQVSTTPTKNSGSRQNMGQAEPAIEVLPQTPSPAKTVTPAKEQVAPPLRGTPSRAGAALVNKSLSMQSITSPSVMRSLKSCCCRDLVTGCKCPPGECPTIPGAKLRAIPQPHHIDWDQMKKPGIFVLNRAGRQAYQCRNVCSPAQVLGDSIWFDCTIGAVAVCDLKDYTGLAYKVGSIKTGNAGTGSSSWKKYWYRPEMFRDPEDQRIHLKAGLMRKLAGTFSSSYNINYVDSIWWIHRNDPFRAEMSLWRKVKESETSPDKIQRIRVPYEKLENRPEPFKDPSGRADIDFYGPEHMAGLTVDEVYDATEETLDDFEPRLRDDPTFGGAVKPPDEDWKEAFIPNTSMYLFTEATNAKKVAESVAESANEQQQDPNDISSGSGNAKSDLTNEELEVIESLKTNQKQVTPTGVNQASVVGGGAPLPSAEVVPPVNLPTSRKRPARKSGKPSSKPQLPIQIVKGKSKKSAIVRKQLQTAKNRAKLQAVKKGGKDGKNLLQSSSAKGGNVVSEGAKDAEFSSDSPSHDLHEELDGLINSLEAQSEDVRRQFEGEQFRLNRLDLTRGVETRGLNEALLNERAREIELKLLRGDLVEKEKDKKAEQRKNPKGVLTPPTWVPPDVQIAICKEMASLWTIATVQKSLKTIEDGVVPKLRQVLQEDQSKQVFLEAAMRASDPQLLGNRLAAQVNHEEETEGPSEGSLKHLQQRVDSLEQLAEKQAQELAYYKTEVPQLKAEVEVLSSLLAKDQSQTEPATRAPSISGISTNNSEGVYLDEVEPIDEIEDEERERTRQQKVELDKQREIELLQREMLEENNDEPHTPANETDQPPLPVNKPKKKKRTKAEERGTSDGKDPRRSLDADFQNRPDNSEPIDLTGEESAAVTGDEMGEAPLKGSMDEYVSVLLKYREAYATHDTLRQAKYAKKIRHRAKSNVQLPSNAYGDLLKSLERCVVEESDDAALALAVEASSLVPVDWRPSAEPAMNSEPIPEFKTPQQLSRCSKPRSDGKSVGNSSPAVYLNQDGLFIHQEPMTPEEVEQIEFLRAKADEVRSASRGRDPSLPSYSVENATPKRPRTLPKNIIFPSVPSEEAGDCLQVMLSGKPLDLKRFENDKMPTSILCKALNMSPDLPLTTKRIMQDILDKVSLGEKMSPKELISKAYESHLFEYWEDIKCMCEDNPEFKDEIMEKGKARLDPNYAELEPDQEDDNDPADVYNPTDDMMFGEGAGSVTRPMKRSHPSGSLSGNASKKGKRSGPPNTTRRTKKRMKKCAKVWDCSKLKIAAPLTAVGKEEYMRGPTSAQALQPTNAYICTMKEAVSMFTCRFISIERVKTLLLKYIDNSYNDMNPINRALIYLQRDFERCWDKSNDSVDNQYRWLRTFIFHMPKRQVSTVEYNFAVMPRFVLEVAVQTLRVLNDHCKEESKLDSAEVPEDDAEALFLHAIGKLIHRLKQRCKDWDWEWGTAGVGAAPRPGALPPAAASGSGNASGNATEESSSVLQ